MWLLCGGFEGVYIQKCINACNVCVAGTVKMMLRAKLRKTLRRSRRSLRILEGNSQTEACSVR